MKKGLLAVLLLGFSVIAAQAYNAGLAKVFVNADLTKNITSVIEKAATEAAEEAAMPPKAFILGNSVVKAELLKIITENASAEFSRTLKDLFYVFDDLYKGVYESVFPKKMALLQAQIEQIRQYDEKVADQVLEALKKGSYMYKYDRFWWPMDSKPMTWDEAVKMIYTPRNWHSVG